MKKSRKWEFVHLQSVNSTNDFLDHYDGDCPIFAMADEQKKGKGRLDREWSSPKGGLYLSYCISDMKAPENLGWIPLFTGLCALDVLKKTGVDVSLKWPNDLMVNGLKIGGILSHADLRGEKVRKVVVGTGINVNNDPPVEGSTSVAAVTGKEQSVQDLADEFMDSVKALFRGFDENLEKMKERYAENCSTLGRRVSVSTPTGFVRGEAKGVGPQGGLIVETDEGERTVLAGDCLHVKPE